MPVTPGHHLVMLALGQQFNGFGAENRTQQAVKGRRCPGTLNMSELGNASLKFFVTLIDFIAQIIADSAVYGFANQILSAGKVRAVFSLDAFGNDNNGMIPAAGLNVFQLFDNRVDFFLKLQKQTKI